MTILLTTAIVFGALLIGSAFTAILKTVNGDWPEPGE